eukprot:3506-Heterococcus_DN1.PRE.7
MTLQTSAQAVKREPHSHSCFEGLPAGCERHQWAVEYVRQRCFLPQCLCEYAVIPPACTRMFSRRDLAIEGVEQKQLQMQLLLL